MANTLQQTIVEKLTTKYPKLTIKGGDTFVWSPGEATVYYRADDLTKEGVWALLHESGHALLGHTTYYSDFELVKLEAEAWKKAKEIATEISEAEIEEDHIQDCLDSYRNWLHKRSLCPDCNLSSAQTDTNTYTCIFPMTIPWPI